MTPTVGRIVHFHPFPGSRPFAAIIVAVWGEKLVNLEVLTDGSNGLVDKAYGFTADECARGRAWRTSISITQDGQIEGASWCWPPLIT